MLAQDWKYGGRDAHWSGVIKKKKHRKKTRLLHWPCPKKKDR